MPEFIDPRFREISPKRSYSVIENERFGLVFAKTGSKISDTDVFVKSIKIENTSTNFTIQLLDRIR